eukprot:251166_1
MSAMSLKRSNAITTIQITITIEPLKTGSFELEIDSNATMDEVKSKIENIKQTPSNMQQILIFGGKILELGHSIAEYSITNGSKMCLAYRSKQTIETQERYYHSDFINKWLLHTYTPLYTPMAHGFQHFNHYIRNEECKTKHKHGITLNDISLILLNLLKPISCDCFEQFYELNHFDIPVMDEHRRYRRAWSPQYFYCQDSSSKLIKLSSMDIQLNNTSMDILYKCDDGFSAPASITTHSTIVGRITYLRFHDKLSVYHNADNLRVKCLFQFNPDRMYHISSMFNNIILWKVRESFDGVQYPLSYICDDHYMISAMVCDFDSVNHKIQVKFDKSIVYHNNHNSPRNEYQWLQHLDKKRFYIHNKIWRNLDSQYLNKFTQLSKLEKAPTDVNLFNAPYSYTPSYYDHGSQDIFDKTSGPAKYNLYFICDDGYIIKAIICGCNDDKTKLHIRFDKDIKEHNENSSHEEYKWFAYFNRDRFYISHKTSDVYNFVQLKSLKKMYLFYHDSEKMKLFAKMLRYYDVKQDTLQRFKLLLDDLQGIHDLNKVISLATKYNVPKQLIMDIVTTSFEDQRSATAQNIQKQSYSKLFDNCEMVCNGSVSDCGTIERMKTLLR